MATEQQLSRELKDSIDTLERNADRIEREFRQVLKSYFRDVQSASRALIRADYASVVELQLELDAMLQDSGYEDLIESYIEVMAELEEEGTRYFQLFGVRPRLDPENAEALDLMLEYHERNLRELTDQRIVKPLRNAVLLANISERSGRDGQELIRAEIDRYRITTRSGEEFTDAQIDTLMRDGMVQYTRTVNNQVAESVGFRIYQYVGPFDNVTRDACRKMLTVNRHGVPGMLYVEEIIALKSELNLPFDPLVGGGGWNCRHEWIAVSDEYAEAQGFQLDGRA